MTLQIVQGTLRPKIIRLIFQGGESTAQKDEFSFLAHLKYRYDFFKVVLKMYSMLNNYAQL